LGSFLTDQQLALTGCGDETDLSGQIRSSVNATLDRNEGGHQRWRGDNKT
jgi:hypothetical protein